MRPLKRFVIPALIYCAGLAGCTTPSIESSPLPGPEPTAPLLVLPDDVLEFHFLHRPIVTAKPYKIGIGDRLRISVLNHEDLKQEGVLVLPDGYISLPLIPRLKVYGDPPEAVAGRIAKLYREQNIRDPDVTVSVETDSGRLRAFLDSVSQGGGQEGIRVTVERDGMIAVPALAPIKAHRPLKDIRRELEDAYAKEFGPELALVVSLAAKAQPALAYVIGEVTKPGPIEINPETNALVAIARAGGFLRSADMQKIRVYRFTPGSGVDQWQVDLEEGLERGTHSGTQLRIQAADVIFVPKTGIAVANDTMDQYIRQMLPTSIGFGISYGIGNNDN